MPASGPQPDRFVPGAEAADQGHAGDGGRLAAIGVCRPALASHRPSEQQCLDRYGSGLNSYFEAAV
jgi:hypothetical protein